MKSIWPKMLRENIKHDLPASLVVFFVAVPLCLGIALASGAPLFSGIIAGIVGGIVVGAISNSPIGVSGPAAGLTVIVLNSISSLGSFESFLTAVVLAGLFQILLGFLRAGIISHFFPMAVVKGMLTAIGIIIIIKQVPHAIGYDKDYLGDLSFWQADGENTLSALTKMLGALSPGAILVCLLALAIIYLWESAVVKKNRVLDFVPGPFVAVMVGIFFQLITVRWFPELSLRVEHLVNVPVAHSLPDFFGQFTLPDFSNITSKKVWITAITISVVASLESLLSVEATDKFDPRGRATDSNRELIAQGTGNAISGLLGGLPITQVILRSTANSHAGGRTKLSTIFHGALILLCVAFIPVVINLVPLAALSAVLFVIGLKLAKPATFHEMYKLGWNQFLPFIVTVAGVVLTDLLTGIVIGIGAAVVILLRNSFNNSYSLRMEVRNGSWFFQLTLAQEVYFVSKSAIRKVLNKIPDGSKVLIDGTKCVTIDHDVREAIFDFKKSAGRKKIGVDILLHPLLNGSERVHKGMEIETEKIDS